MSIFIIFISLLSLGKNLSAWFLCNVNCERAAAFFKHFALDFVNIIEHIHIGIGEVEMDGNGFIAVKSIELFGLVAIGLVNSWIAETKAAWMILYIYILWTITAIIFLRFGFWYYILQGYWQTEYLVVCIRWYIILTYRERARDKPVDHAATCRKVRC